MHLFIWWFVFSLSFPLDSKFHEMWCCVWIWIHRIFLSYEFCILSWTFQHFLEAFCNGQMFLQEGKKRRWSSERPLKTSRFLETESAQNRLRMKSPLLGAFPKLKSNHDIHTIHVFDSLKYHQKSSILPTRHENPSVTRAQPGFWAYFLSHCAMDWMFCISPKFICLSLNPNVMVFGGD